MQILDPSILSPNRLNLLLLILKVYYMRETPLLLKRDCMRLLLSSTFYTKLDEEPLAYNQALNAYFLELQGNSKYGYLIPDS